MDPTNEDKMIEQSVPSILDAAFEEDRLVAETKQNPGAFLGLYDRYLAPIYRYLACRVGDPKDAEDLTAQVFLTAFERFAQYRGQGKFAAWLFTIARNKSIDFFRAHRRELPLETTLLCKAGVVEGSARQDEIRAILDIIASLSPEERELLDLRFAAEMSFREIAGLLHRTESAVKKQVYRLLARIKKEMEDTHE